MHHHHKSSKVVNAARGWWRVPELYRLTTWPYLSIRNLAKFQRMSSPSGRPAQGTSGGGMSGRRGARAARRGGAGFNGQPGARRSGVLLLAAVSCNLPHLALAAS